MSPCRIAGRQIAALATRPALVEVMEIHHSGAEIAVKELVVPDRSPVAGRTLESMRPLDSSGAQTLGATPRRRDIHVNPAFVVKECDLIVALSSAGQLGEGGGLVAASGRGRRRRCFPHRDCSSQKRGGEKPPLSRLGC
jgi:Trk K+ transport system NAD-binding subunit